MALAVAKGAEEVLALGVDDLHSFSFGREGCAVRGTIAVGVEPQAAGRREQDDAQTHQPSCGDSRRLCSVYDA
jgi:hypothetical protein